MTIIAEIGQNFVRDMQLARCLIDLAKINGADLVKFQLYDSKILYGKYQDTELSKKQAFELFNFGKEIGIEVFFSIFDVERVKWCEEMGVKRYKIATKMRDPDVMEAIQATGKPILISASHYHCAGEPSVANAQWLFCVSEYPAVLTCLPDFEEEWMFEGFSDHTIGLDVAKIAIARGAKIIEKHFAIDHKTGIDAAWSMTPEELRELRRFYDLVQEVL